MDAGQRRRQLGEIMVAEGFITAEQLTAALEEQGRTGRPLGKVLVDLGLVSTGAVANVLAEQHGGLLKTEFGISAGLAPRPAPLPLPGPAEATVSAEAAAQLASVTEERDRLQAALAELEAAATAQITELEAAATARIVELQQQLQAAADERIPFVDELLATRARADAAEAALRAAEAQIAELEAAPPPEAVPEPEPEPVTEPELAHVLLVPSPGGYELVERPGPPPASGTLVDVAGRSFVAGRVRRSPLPDGGVARRCIVLHPL